MDAVREGCSQKVHDVIDFFEQYGDRLSVEELHEIKTICQAHPDIAEGLMRMLTIYNPDRSEPTYCSVSGPGGIRWSVDHTFLERILKSIVERGIFQSLQVTEAHLEQLSQDDPIAERARHVRKLFQTIVGNEISMTVGPLADSLLSLDFWDTCIANVPGESRARLLHGFVRIQQILSQVNEYLRYSASAEDIENIRANLGLVCQRFIETHGTLAPDTILDYMPADLAQKFGVQPIMPPPHRLV